MADLATSGPAGHAGIDTPVSTRTVVAATLAVLWAVALWQSWECAGLFADGAVFFLDMVRESALYIEFDDPRGLGILVTQAPTRLAIELGVRDLHWLARLYSFCLFAAPLALYSFAVVRAGRDPALQAATLVATATIFLAASNLIIGEYNLAYACAVFSAVWLTTASDLRVRDGVVLVLVAAVATRAYQHYVYLGPMLGLLTIWSTTRATGKPWVAVGLHAIAAAFFFHAGYIAAESLIAMYGNAEQRTYMVAVAGNGRNFYLNVQLDLLLLAAAIAVAWALWRPVDLRRPGPWIVTGVLVVLTAASPALVLVKGVLVPPYAGPQAWSRTFVGLLVALFIAFVWLATSGHARWPALAVLREPRVARRVVLVGCAMALATMPWNIMLTGFYKRYLEVVRTTIRSQGGLIPIEQAIVDRYPRIANADIAPATLSLIMRTSPTDGVLVNDIRNPADLPNPLSPPDLGRFFWRD